ncbi:NACHT, LRR and PYD domains-containing protein 6-like [Anomaloglossus baeobatrachus]
MDHSMYQEPMQVSRFDDDEGRQFHRQLCQYKDHAVRMIHEYFQDDLLHTLENVNIQLLLDELHYQNVPDVEKYVCLQNDRKQFSQTLLRDIHNLGKNSVIGLWVSLFTLQKNHLLPTFQAVLDELCTEGTTLVEKILLDENGHILLQELKDVQNCHKQHLLKRTEKLVDNKPPGCNQQNKSFSFCTRFVSLMIVSTENFRKRSENELIQTGVKHEKYVKRRQNELQRIFPNKLFRWCHRSRLVPQMVMVSGVPGIGKTTLMQKFVYDWARGDLYQRFSFVFFFKFRELNRLDNVSLETLILYQYPYLDEQLEDILQDPEKLLFIFDGLDESFHTLDFTSCHLCSNPKQPESCGQIVVSLVGKSLLKGCSVLMTSRQNSLTSIDCNIFQRIVEIIGFFAEERQMYFENFFFYPSMYQEPMHLTGPHEDDDTQKFYRQLCRYKDHELRLTYEYFQDDLLHILENLNLQFLLSELKSRNILDTEKYLCLRENRKLLSHTLLSDIHKLGREAVTELWVSLYVLQRNHPTIQAVLDELCEEDLVHKIVLDEDGHSLPPKLKDAQSSHKTHLLEKTEKLVENKPPGYHQQEESFSLRTRYVNLIIASTQQFRQCFENELIETGVKHEEYLKKAKHKLLHISSNKLFRWCHRSRLVPQMVMVSGVPGIGKTTLMQKFVHDWTRGVLYQRFSFVFFFKFRELNRLDNISLETLILHQYPHLEEQLANILQDPEKLLFIFDGLDESLHTLDFTSRHLCSHPKQPEPCGQIVVSLVRKSLLNGCSVLMTSRPTRLASIDCSVFQRIVEIIGFFPEERQMYFENFFPNHELAEKAFHYVKQNETLYTFCYLPSYCWIICTVLSRSFQPRSRNQPISLLPKTVTQLFAIFIANILSNHSLYKSDAQQLLRSIGWMAEHGVMNHRIIFEYRDLDSFHVDNKSKLLSSFLMESGDPVYYSFLHLTVQEFFSALVHYVDYSPEKLQKSLKDANSYSDGRGEIFLRFMFGLSDGSTRSILDAYVDTRAAQASRDVITWVRDYILERNQLEESEDKKQRLQSPPIFPKQQRQPQYLLQRRHLLIAFSYLFETRNKQLVQESFTIYKSFDLSSVHMSALDCTVLTFILETCRNIENLTLDECFLTTEGLERLAPVLHNLKNLSFLSNNLDDEAMKSLVSVLTNPSSKIVSLSLAYNELTDCSCIQLASVIRKNRSLKILNLSNNRLSGPHFHDLKEALSSPDCRIKELVLSCNNLNQDDCIHLASVIKQNQSLEKLVLSGNDLSSLNFSDLMEALSRPDHKIKELHIQDCNISEDHKEALRNLRRQYHNLNILFD